MKTFKIERLILILISLTLVLGLFTIYQRIKVEKQYKTVEFVLDYSEMDKLAKSSDESLGIWLKRFKGYGAQSVAVQEETINTLMESGHYLKAEIVSELIKNYNWEKNYPDEIVSGINNGRIKAANGIITIDDGALYNFIVSGLTERYPDEFFDNIKIDNKYYIILKGNSDDLYFGSVQKVFNIDGDGVYENKKIVDSRIFNIGIGYDAEKINIIKNSGLDVVLRPINYSAFNEKLIDVYKASNDLYGIKPRLYLLYGKEILGYPDNEDLMASYVREYNIAPVLIESSNQRENLDQKGLKKLVENSGYNAVRAFTMWDYIRQRNKFYNYQGAEEIENTMFRAITERNIRVIYFKPFFTEEGSSKYLTDKDEYERTFTSLKTRLKEHNINFGNADSISEFHIGSKRLAILTFGIALSSVYLFIKMFNIKNKYSSYLYLISLPAAAMPLVMRNISEKVFALGAAVVFSGLAIYFFMMQIRNIYKSDKKLSLIQIMARSTVVLTLSIAISLIGAVFVDSVLCDVRYFLEMDIFRGVKAEQILPFAIFLVMYLIYFMNKNNDNSFKSVVNTTIRFLNIDIKIYYAIIAGILAIIGYIYIARTGHETDIQPSKIEMIFRNLMEYVLLARPRTKEFLIAFPAMFAAVYAANKKSEFFTGIFMLAAAMGTSSVINTFSHLRTPIYLSLARTVIALGMGIAIGCILTLVLDILYRIYGNLQEKLK